MQGVTVLGQGGVQVAQLRFERLLVAHDRPDQLALELQRRGVAGELEEHGVQAQRCPAAAEISPRLARRSPTTRTDLPSIDEGTDGVDGRLGLAGARRGADHQRVSGPDGVHDVLLVRVGVEQQQFVGRVPLVGAREAARS